MHWHKENIIKIANSDDKRQITAVLAVTSTGEYLPPQMIIILLGKNSPLSTKGNISE